MYALTTQDVHGVILLNGIIRRLMPIECFRLQGFADNQFQTLADNGISDSQLYKMAGNSVTTNVVTAIAEKLAWDINLLRYESEVFSSEAVSKYHPDKYADQISDAILTECLKQDRQSHCGIETMVKGNTVVLGGEITS